MSWLFGVIGPSVDEAEHSRCRTIHAHALHVFTNPNGYYIAAGGRADTCLAAAASDAPGGTAFALCLGSMFVAAEGSAQEFLSADGWARHAFAPPSSNRVHEGHYVHLKYAAGTFRITTDRLGLRTIYWAAASGRTVLSTRLDWIGRYLSSHADIDFAKLGSRWLLYNPLTYDAPIHGVERLGPSGLLVIGRGGVESVAFEQYTPVVRSAETSMRTFAERLRSALVLSPRSGREISLGLSGGLDSRVLLALRLRSAAHARPIHVHTFGSESDPDVAVARRIARAEDLSHQVFNAPPASSAEALNLCTEYIAQTNLAEACSTGLRLKQYAMLDPERFVLSDGGFGEVARRQYLNRLAFKGQAAIERCDIDAIFSCLHYRRARCFTQDVEAEMMRGVADEIRRAFGAMPAVATLGMGNYLDLLAVRTRVPNFTCDEQARLDTLILNDMPFARPSVFDAIFSLPVERRRNGTLLRMMIGEYCPRLRRYPLVKYNTTHPFVLPTYPSRIWTKAKMTMGLAFRDDTVHDVLSMLKDYVLDTLRSKSVIEYGPYDYRTIERNVFGYYGGDRGLASEVNWWLSFELWRKNLADCRSTADASGPRDY